MKRFALKFFLFLFPIIVLLYPLDLVISNNLRKSNLHAHKEYPTWNAILESNLNSEVFIYGSSRAWVHFDPIIIADSLNTSVFNLGIDGHTFSLQYLRHTLALKYNKRPKLIIHSVDAGTLQKGNLYNAEQFLPFMLWDFDFHNALSNYDGYSRIDYVVPLIRYYGRMESLSESLNLLVNPLNNPIARINGYEGQNTEWNTDFDEAKKKMKTYSVLIDQQTAVAFEKYLQECKSKNIKVVLVYSPYYIEGQNFINNQNQIIKYYEQVALKYNFNFIDFTKDEICFEKKYFYNASHMNKRGAEIFSKKLGSMIKHNILPL